MDNINKINEEIKDVQNERLKNALADFLDCNELSRSQTWLLYSFVDFLGGR